MCKKPPKTAFLKECMNSSENGKYNLKIIKGKESEN